MTTVSSISMAQSQPQPLADPATNTQPRPRVGIERLAMQRQNDQPKSSMNCQSCRKRKIKCNRLLPGCEACQTFRSKCIYDAVPRKRGPKTNPLKTRIRKAAKLHLDFPAQMEGSFQAFADAGRGPRTTNEVGVVSRHSPQPAAYRNYNFAAPVILSTHGVSPPGSIPSHEDDTTSVNASNDRHHMGARMYATYPRSAPAYYESCQDPWARERYTSSPAASVATFDSSYHDLPLTPMSIPCQPPLIHQDLQAMAAPHIEEYSSESAYKVATDVGRLPHTSRAMEHQHPSSIRRSHPHSHQTSPDHLPDSAAYPYYAPQSPAILAPVTTSGASYQSRTSCDDGSVQAGSPGGSCATAESPVEQERMYHILMEQWAANGVQHYPQQPSHPQHAPAWSNRCSSGPPQHQYLPEWSWGGRPGREPASRPAA